MPIRRRTYRRKRRPTTRKRVQRRRTIRLVKSVGQPHKVVLKLRYTDLRQVSVAASARDARTWNLNSMYDPDESGTGGQPYLHDQYSALYQRYRVFGCKVLMRCVCASTSTNMYFPHAVLVPFVGGSPSWSSTENAMQAPYAVWKTFIPNQTIATFKKYYSIASLFGVTKRHVRDEDSFSADTASNPTNRAYVQIYVDNNDGTNAVSLQCEISLTYYVMYYQPKQQSAS